MMPEQADQLLRILERIETAQKRTADLLEKLYEHAHNKDRNESRDRLMGRR